MTERICPFCATSLEPLPDAAEIAVPSGASRAQRLALAAALGGQGLLGCAQTEPTYVPAYGVPVSGSPAPQAGQTAPPVQPAAGRGGIGAPVYGAPVAGQPGGIGGPVYGAPIAGQPAPRAGGAAPDDDAGTPEAGHAAAGSGGNVAAPVYGAPIPEYGAPPPPKN